MIEATITLINPTAPSAPSAPSTNTPTMSTSEITELTAKLHPHVIRDTGEMLDQLGDGPNLDHVREEKDARGYTAAFHLPKDLTLALVAGYSILQRQQPWRTPPHAV